MNLQPDRHKHALVTGGNKGIGFAICQGLLTAGFEVTLAARSSDKAKAAITSGRLRQRTTSIRSSTSLSARCC